MVASTQQKKRLVGEVLFKLNLAGNCPGDDKGMSLREQNDQSQVSELAYSLSLGPRGHASSARELKGEAVPQTDNRAIRQ